MSRDGVSVAGPLVAADAPPANDKDIPATPNTGTAFLRRFRFEASFVCAIAEFSIPFEHMVDPTFNVSPFTPREQA